VLVVAGEWGLGPDVHERVVMPLAEHGFFVVATDLMHGHRASSAAEASVRAEGIDPAGALDDISAGLLTLKELASGKIGVIGLDRAATIALEAATVLPQIDAVVHVGGAPPASTARMSRMRAAVLVTRTDQGAMTKAAYAELIERMKRSKAPLLGHDYPASEGFFLRPRDEEERHQATIASDRIRDFLTFNLT
jgi:dienelactone hydrolase